MLDINSHFALKNNDFETREQFDIGREVKLSKKITELDLENLVKLTGDNNPLHIDENFAKRSMFKKRIVHGTIAVGLISSALTRLMGPGNVWLSQNLEFKKPILIDDTLTVHAKIIEITKSKICTIETTCHNQKGDLIVQGIAKSRVFPIHPKKKT